MLDNLKSLYYNIIYGIQNLFVYFSVIWKTREWDFEFIYELIQFKLKRVRKHLEEHNLFENVDKTCQQIRICENLIQRLLDNDYNKFLHKKHEEKFGKFNFESIFYKKGKTDDEDLYELKSKYSKCKNDNEVDLADEEKHKIYMLDGLAYEKDRKLLFKILEKYIEGWWD